MKNQQLVPLCGRVIAFIQRFPDAMGRRNGVHRYELILSRGNSSNDTSECPGCEYSSSNMLWRLLRAAGLLPIVAACLIFLPLELLPENHSRIGYLFNVRGTAVEVFFYRPKGCFQPALLFVFHGLSRAAASYRNSACDAADRYCLIVYAPLFDEERFPNWKYHRGEL
jgi:hypothetical protein